MQKRKNLVRRAAIMLLALCACGVAAASPNGVVSHELGGVKFYALADSVAARNMSIFKGADPELLGKYYPDGSYTGTVAVFILKTPAGNILFDTGFGLKENSPGGKMFAYLPAAGLKPEDINSIVLTHTHQDHVGGLLKDGRAAFPGATIYICRQEDAFWQSSQAKLREEVYAAYNNRVTVFEAGREILPGVLSVAAFGHTPGHTAFLLHNKILIAGDYLHATALQLAQPQVCPVYDMDREKAVAVRLMLLDLAAGKDYLLTGMHMAFPSLGYVKKAGNGYSFSNISP